MQFCDRNENDDDVIQRGSIDNILRTDIECPEGIENESSSNEPSTSVQIPNPSNNTNSTENVVNDSSSSDENDNEVRLPTSMCDCSTNIYIKRNIKSPFSGKTI